LAWLGDNRPVTLMRRRRGSVRRGVVIESVLDAPASPPVVENSRLDSPPIR
jgi:hypothetical protein